MHKTTPLLNFRAFPHKPTKAEQSLVKFCQASEIPCIFYGVLHNRKHLQAACEPKDSAALGAVWSPVLQKYILLNNPL